MISHGQLLTALTSSALFRTYARAYSETTGMPIALRPVETWQLPFHGKHKENTWCALMSEQSRTCASCLQVQEKLAKASSNGPATVICAYGLCETAVPVKLGPLTIGFLQTGQVLREKPTTASFQRALAKVEELGVSLPTAEAQEAYFSTPVASQRKLSSVADLLTIFAEHLSMKSNQIAMLRANAEHPIIARAKDYVREHHSEELSLSRVAGSAHVSIYYFCKLFRKVTGTTLTTFVSRTRVEKAKNLLINPNLRISEIAYNVGFQSITHFNRVFKSVTGESPTRYRERLPISASRNSVTKMSLKA
ncbi:MAG: helix-turn-helix domain-containing protein [Verrucomicrobiales bacterium]|nr:helix-turn-helix domain-containing protein [Verrucomicrobiales bacterium]